jgi:hypothetical protein
VKAILQKCLLSFVPLALLAAYPVLAKADLLLVLPASGMVEANLLLAETFDSEDAWERYSNPNGVELGIVDGVYRAYTMNEGFVWGLNAQEHDNVVLEVEVTPLTPNFENGYGIMCRADTHNNGNGYYFMINANGYYSIQIGKGESILPLVDWTASNRIHAELDQNTIRAVCLDDHLAMYVNGELLAEVTDENYAVGYAGIAIAAAPNSDMDAAFDNLMIYEISQ